MRMDSRWRHLANTTDGFGGIAVVMVPGESG